MKDLENFLQAVQDKVGQAKFSERLKEIDNFFYQWNSIFISGSQRSIILLYCRLYGHSQKQGTLIYSNRICTYLSYAFQFEQ